MHETKPDELRDLLQRKAQTARKEALGSDGQVPPGQVEFLERLARLVEIWEVAQPKLARNHWPVVAIFLGTLFIASVLLFARVSETEIELDSTLSEVSFTLSRRQPVLPRLSLSALGASGLREIRLPRSRDEEAQILASPDGAELDILLSASSEGGRQGTVSIDALTLPAGMRVGVNSTDAPQQWQFSLRGEGVELSASVNGFVSVGPSGAPAREFIFVSPKPVLLESGGSEVQLKLAVLGASLVTLSSQLSVEGLSLSRIEEVVDARHTAVRHISTILSGTLYLESLNSQQFALRPGEEVQFEQSHGEIRALRLDVDHLAMKFHGRVRGMSVGSGDGRRSLMPTWLEWLKARHGLSLLWGTALYLFGLIVGALRWWRVSE